jgi:hypothetical protein
MVINLKKRLINNSINRVRCLRLGFSNTSWKNLNGKPMKIIPFSVDYVQDTKIWQIKWLKVFRVLSK